MFLELPFRVEQKNIDAMISISAIGKTLINFSGFIVNILSRKKKSQITPPEEKII